MRSIRFRTVLGVVFLLTLVTAAAYAAPLQAPSLAVTAPGASGITLAEMDEFATTVMGDSWDMNQPSDLAFIRRESNISNSAFANGIYSGMILNGNGTERITLLTAGSPNNTAMRVGKIGYAYPIDANHYRYLTFRMYSSNTNCNSGLIEWFSDDNYSSPASHGVSNSFLVPPVAAAPCTNQPSGWFTYTLDLQNIGIQQGSLNWTGMIRELLIHPFAGPGAQNSTVKLDWARLTAADPRTARPYTIQWTGNGTGGNVTLYASATKTTSTDNDIVIVAGLNAAGGGAFVFQTGVLPSGSYFIGASNSNGIAWSAGPLIINAPPQIAITKPSMTSGQDYATTIIGNPWDMSNSADLVQPSYCLTPEIFSGGIYSATIPNPVCPSSGTYSDDQLLLGGMSPNPPGTLDPIIDTSRFRYFSYRFKHSGTQDVGNGWVSRIFWAQVNASKTGFNQPWSIGRDIIIQEDWNRYKIDLLAPDSLDETVVGTELTWAQAQPNRLRFDPSELAASLTPATIQMDWITLTAMDEVTHGTAFPIQYAISATLPVTLTFYYDTNTNPSDGRTLIGSGSAAPQRLSGVNMPLSSRAPGLQASTTYSIYLPLILNSAAGCGAGCFLWNTTNVLPGTYYICINAQDAYNSNYRCSEAPVIVR